ncbi:MAG: aminoacyl-tRNA hydrolase [Firmicutes bacterium]|nr:aminoacyl-tRNA hydrolase [Bacillota bacterium]
MFILLGLGNPGPRYALSRHNVGFRVVDHISGAAKIPLYKVGCHAFWGKGIWAGQTVVLAKPMTYMNNSGKAAAALCRYFGVSAASLLVIYDDLDLPLGTLRLRQQGGSGGHNGINSLIYSLQTEQFPRLRIGIGRPADRNDVVEYVLSSFSVEEEDMLVSVLETAVQASKHFILEGIGAAMNRFNKRG